MEFSRPHTAEELEVLEKLKGKMIPLCSVPRCEKIAGHEGDHGPVRLNLERVTA